jgi:hypothetical protein
MPTHDYIISNGTGAAVRADINSALSAIVSLNSSASEPATMYAYQLWADTTNGLLKIRNSANTAWIALRQLDGDFSIVAVEDGLLATPSLTFTNDLNTGIFRPGNDQLAIVTAGTRRLLIDSTGALTIDTGDAEIYGVRVGRGGGAVSSNTAAGSLALNANTIGAFNTAVGKNALTLNAGGTDNTAMGSSALGGNTSGIGNTAIGLQSLFTNSTANFNTAIGLGALYTNNAANNTAVGVGALKFNSSGTTNTALGTIALENNTLGSNNICLGYNSGSSLTTGSNNTIIGQIPGTAALADTLIMGIGSTERLRITSTNTLNFVGAGTAGSTQTVSLSGSAPINSIVLDSSGRLLVGTSTARSNLYTGSLSAALQVEGTTYSTSAFLIIANGSSSAQNPYPILYLGRSRGATVGSNTVVQSGDQVGAVIFTGADGTNLIPTASIESYVDGTPGANDMPGRLVFSTTPDGGSSPTLSPPAMTIKSSQEVLIGTSTITANGGILQLKSGITFPATAVAASDANTLDDYEEGTFTPTVSGGSTAGSGTYSSQVGKYVKIGGKVFVEVALVWSAHTGTGNMFLTGLPFTSAADESGAGISVGRVNNLAITALCYLTGYILNSNTAIALRAIPTGGGAENAVGLDTAAEINYSITYMVV